jgi:TRAP-type C4-dicarboxylate transport system substrate-binding protein
VAASLGSGAGRGSWRERAKRTASTLAAAIPGGSVEAMRRSRGAVMTRRRFVVGAAAVAVAPALAGCSSLERAAGTDVDAPWRMSSSMPGDPGNAHSEWLAAFKDAVGGALRVDYYPDSQLGDEAKSVPQVRIGAVDLMISGSSIWSTVVPEFGLLDMGYLFDNWDDVAAALDGDVGAALARRLHAKTGLEIIGWPFNFGVRNVLTTRAVARPDDLKGLKGARCRPPRWSDARSDGGGGYSDRHR